MLSNAYFLANFRFDTAENEPAKNLQILQKKANLGDRDPVEGIAATDLRDPAAAVRQPASPPVRRLTGASGDAPRQPTTYFSL